MQYYRLKDIKISDCMNSRIFVIFLADDVKVADTKDGAKYISLNLCDISVKVPAKKFGASDKDIEMMKNGVVYSAAIDVKEYKGAPSLTIYNFDVFDRLEPSNFVEWAQGIEEANSIIQSSLEKLNGSIYRDLVCSILSDNWTKFSVWSAASSMHHNILGGLIVHTAEVVEQSMIIADMWNKKYGENFVNKQLLISGALLHDVAKTQELDVNTMNGHTEYSVASSMGTHLTMGATLIDIYAYRLHIGQQVVVKNEVGNDIPTKTDQQIAREIEQISLLKHLILSHHGKLEYGAAILPHTPEALILSEADTISAEMYRYNRDFKNMEPATTTSVWTSTGMLLTYKESTK